MKWVATMDRNTIVDIDIVTFYSRVLNSVMEGKQMISFVFTHDLCCGCKYKRREKDFFFRLKKGICRSQHKTHEGWGQLRYMAESLLIKKLYIVLECGLLNIYPSFLWKSVSSNLLNAQAFLIVHTEISAIIPFSVAYILSHRWQSKLYNNVTWLQLQLVSS